jgi:hydroxymethylpyrimidine pyrophosphatase-like HAD family hydrolase
MANKQIIGIDWDHTIYDTASNTLLPGAADAIWALRERGYRILIHSCNNPQWIRMKCEELGLIVDYVWGETGMEQGKPVCAVYIDDRAVGFRGDWADALNEALMMVGERPIKDYRGPQYLPNPKREAELDGV